MENNRNYPCPTNISQQLPPAPYKRLCCLLLNWTDAPVGKAEQVAALQSLLKHKYGAFVTSETLDHADWRDSEQSFLHHVEKFLRKNGNRDDLLVVFYSGCSYVHRGEMFLDPHIHAQPSVRWSGFIDQKILSSVANCLLIFDTTNLRHDHYSQMWIHTCERVEKFYMDRQMDQRNTLALLAVNGLETQGLISSLESMAENCQDGFTVSQLTASCQTDMRGLDKPSTMLYLTRPTKMLQNTEILLVPLARPKLQLYEHHIFLDPHNEYLKSIKAIPIQEDGTCEVLRMKLGPEVQEYSPSCLVAIKRFTIKRTSRPYLREDFLREKESLVKVSKWHHEHILGMLGTFETRCSGFDTLNLVLPYAEGRNLHQFLRLEKDDFVRLEGNSQWEKQGYPISDPSLIGCLQDWRYAVYRQAVGLIDALAVLHKEKQGKFIMHCDIKPANVLIQNGKFKLADFGLSRIKDGDEDSQTEWHRGTLMYSPPEKGDLMGRGRDVWALGCVLLEIALMIRFAGQDVIAYDITAHKNMIDIFEDSRKKSLPKGGGDHNAIYHRTMGCVHNEMAHFDRMRPGLRRMITREGMFPTIRRMMEEDQENRTTAAEAYKAMRNHYLSLQTDPQLQRPIECRDNPGGPPVGAPINHDGSWNSIGSPQARREDTGFVPRHQESSPHTGGPFIRPSFDYGMHYQSFGGGQRVFLASESGYAVDSQNTPDACPPATPDSQFPKPSIPRNTPAESLSSSATAQLDELDIQDRKRPASEDDLSEGSKRRRASPFY